MAREELDREDLLREATALVERVELRLQHQPESVVVGFRRDGGASFFFGADPVYQFNSRGELRRAYVAGKLLKAERGALIELARVRTSQETQLVRHDYDAAEAEVVLTAMTFRLRRLREALIGRIDVVGQVPPDSDVIARVRRELTALSGPPKIASSPRAG